MMFKTILVNLNHEERVPELVAAAAAIARPEQAHVVGLYVMPPLFMPSDVVMPLGSEFYEEQVMEHRAQAGRIKQLFDRSTHGESFVAEWRVHGDARTAYASVADGVIEEAYAVELVIVSQAVSGQDSPFLADIAERVALESGRPVLVIPKSWTARKCGQDITVAWNDTRESARATFDALPLLQRAKKVRLVTVQETDTEPGRNEIASAEAAAALARYGMDVEVESIANGGRHIGNAILARLAADGSDMLVMGAYGHTRMREFILGGATRDVLKNMTVPVLLSH